jgi:aryl-alcohol dehydrogenase-like predicted oxidoreductase
MGECSKETAFEMLDHFHACGGNFIDTANRYMEGESEAWLGEWMALRQTRGQMILATKYTNVVRSSEAEGVIVSNYAGNGKKSLRLALEESLQRLQTAYIDLYYVHVWDGLTSIPELMRSLDDVVRAGKVLYLGVSNWPAWIVVKANDYAREHSLTPFVAYEGRWSPADREIEREIVPMCKAEGMAITVWGALGGGKFKSTLHAKEDGGRNFPADLGGASLETFRKIAVVMEELGKQKGTDATAVALRYVMLKVSGDTRVF